MLKKGGRWLNIGPLHYHYSDTPGEVSIELTWEEIVSTLKNFGLTLEKQVTGIPSRYAGSPDTMKREEYSSVFSVCVKTEETKAGWVPTEKSKLESRVKSQTANPKAR